MRLIRDYWVNGPPPDDDSTLARILRIERREWSKIRPVIAQFFEIRDGHWYHDKVEKERAKADEIAAKRREAGGRGGRPKKQTESKPKANGFSDEKQKGSQNETHARVASPLPPPSEVIAAASFSAQSERDDANAMWSIRLAEAHAAGGDALNLTSGSLLTYRDLRTLCEPQSGEPCRWDEVLDAIRICAAKQKARGKPIRSWTWVHEEALAIRDRRLNNSHLPAPKAPHEQPSRHNRKQSAYLDRLADIDAAMEAAFQPDVRSN
jgi:uncharacterized protein YdaU (DUF1376 family)